MIWLAGLKNNITLVLILAIAGLLGFLYLKTQSLEKTNELLNVKIEQKDAQIVQLNANMQSLTSSIETQSRELTAFYDKTRKVQNDMRNKLKIFEEHNLRNLSREKPGLIELRVNKATEEVFREIENETQTFN